MRIFVDIRTNRVVYFTDTDEHLHPDQNTAHVDYLGEWPEDITHRNCWNWVLEDRNLVHLPEKPKNSAKSLLETNKTATIALLRRKINDNRQALTSSMHFESVILARKLDAAQDYLDTGTASFILTRLAAIYGKSLPEMAKSILDDWTAKERALMQTEVQLHEFLNRIDEAQTSEEVLLIHSEIVKL